MNIIQFFLQYNNEQGDTVVQDATRLNRDLIDNLIHAYYQNVLLIYPNEQNNKYEHEKSELIEQLIHHVHASNQTISVHDFLLVVQHIHHEQEWRCICAITKVYNACVHTTYIKWHRWI